MYTQRSITKYTYKRLRRFLVHSTDHSIISNIVSCIQRMQIFNLEKEEEESKNTTTFFSL